MFSNISNTDSTARPQAQKLKLHSCVQRSSRRVSSPELRNREHLKHGKTRFKPCPHHVCLNPDAAMRDTLTTVPYPKLCEP